MKKKRLYYLAAVLLLVVFIFAYHIYAARKAEKELDEAIQQQAAKAAYPVSVQYSSISVSPFKGDLILNDFIITTPDGIGRSSHILIDMSYGDFLNIYLGGTEYGLKKIQALKVRTTNTSYLQRNGLNEFKFDSLNLAYSGDLWQSLRSLYSTAPIPEQAHIRAEGRTFHYSRPDSPVGSFLADSVSVNQNLAFSANNVNTLSFKGLTWTPPSSFQQRYAFFIKGFGLQSDAIPARTASFQYSIPDGSHITLTEGTIFTPLGKIMVSGTLQKTPGPEGTIQLNPLEVTINNFSDQVQRVLQNMEQLLGRKLPVRENNIHFKLAGPLSNPRLLKK